MTNLTKARGAVYAVALVIGMAFVALGLGTFDPETGMVDPHPFNLYLVLPAIVALLGAPLTALVAVIKGWGGK